jgi:hypothetical protein
LVSQPSFNHIEATASIVRKILYVIKGYLKRSVLDPRKVRITDANGKTKGYIRKDTLQPSRTKWGVYNSNGNREATIQQDIFQPQDKYQITTRKGKTGTIKRDILNRNTWVIEP